MRDKLASTSQQWPRKTQTSEQNVRTTEIRDRQRPAQDLCCCINNNVQQLNGTCRRSSHLLWVQNQNYILCSYFCHFINHVFVSYSCENSYEYKYSIVYIRVIVRNHVTAVALFDPPSLYPVASQNRTRSAHARVQKEEYRRTTRTAVLYMYWSVQQVPRGCTVRF